MKRFKKIYYLLGVLGAALIATFLVKNHEQKKEEIKNTDEVILNIDYDSVKALSWDSSETSLAFTKNEEGKWVWSEDEAFPVDEDVIKNLIATFEEFGAAFSIDNVDDYSQYGLDEPTCTINLETEDEEYEIKLGDFSTMDSERYVSVGDGKVYLVKEDPYDSFNMELKYIILNDTVPNVSDLTKIQFAGDQDYTITNEDGVVKTYCEADTYFTTVGGETVPLDSDKIADYANCISQLYLGDYATYNVTDDELKEYGLDNPQYTITVDYKTKDEDENEVAETFVLHLSQNPEELAKKTETEAAGNEYSGSVTSYARVGDSQIVYEITETEFEELAACSYDDLRHDEVLTADFSDVTGMDITIEDKGYEITSKESEDKSSEDRDYYYNDEKLDIASFCSALNDLTISEFADSEPTDKKEISITFHLDNEDYPEVSVDIYRFDGTSCLVVLDGKTLGLVSRTNAVSLIEAVNAIILG